MRTKSQEKQEKPEKPKYPKSKRFPPLPFPLDGGKPEHPLGWS